MNLVAYQASFAVDPLEVYEEFELLKGLIRMINLLPFRRHMEVNVKKIWKKNKMV